MKIVIDVRCLMGGKRTGVGEYALNLLLNFFSLDAKNEYVLFFNSWKNPDFDFSVFNKYENVTLKKLRFPNKLLNFFFWYLNWPKIDQLVGGADVVFMPNIIFGSVSDKAKLVLTIHDLSFEIHPQYFSWKRRWWHIFINTKKLCQRADKIIAVSDSTKDDLIALYKIKPEKIMVIHSAVDEKFRIIDRNDLNLLTVKEKYKLPYKFILFLGTIEPRKNIISLIGAFNELQKEGNEEINKYKLVIAGARGWLYKDIFKEIAKSLYKDKIIFTDFIEDKDKEYLYNLASLFVYPSFLEGFGFPPLEAMKCGLPVITANSSSLPEVVGEAGILIDPYKPGEILEAMKEILLSKQLRETLSHKGLKKSEEFNWRKTAKETIDLFNKPY